MTEVSHQQRREAEEVGCFGLISGAARKLHTGEVVYAADCIKADGPFFCGRCYSDVVVRKCTEKRDHFAHKARLSPVLERGEGKLHLACKEEILQGLATRFPDGKWAVERPIRANAKRDTPDLRPDISGWIGPTPVAIEVQASALTVTKIIQRARAYSRWGIALLWIVPLHRQLGDAPFRPRLYERYLHSIYYGRTYYWWAGQGITVVPVHYGPASRLIEYREWREDREERYAGGYEVTYRVIKKPVYGRAINIVDDFAAYARGEFTPDNEQKSVPQCLIWKDGLPPWWGVAASGDRRRLDAAAATEP